MLSQKIKLNIKDAPWSECDCGGTIFEPKVMFKRISSVISTTGKEEFLPIDVIICEQCKKVPSFIYKQIPSFPEEMKAIKKII